MKTDALIAMLASGVVPVAPDTARKRFQTALVWGLAGALVIMVLVFGVRRDLGDAARLPMFWIKLAFPLALAVPALVLSARLSHPGVRLGAQQYALVLPWLLLTALAAWVLLRAAPDERVALVMGKTWASCAFNIALISVPALASVLWAMKGLAPTRPALAGACGGLLSAALGTLVYTLHCPEMQAPFLAVWYVLGMLIPTAAGALLGSKLLRW
jgi:hypothetical protein